MRLFIGIKAGCTAYLQGLQRQLQTVGHGRLTAKENLHLTLKFLGELAPSAVDVLREAICELQAAPFRLECTGLQMFNKSGIVSAKVGGDTQRLHALHAKLEDALAARGFQRDTRSFRPHITLARGFKPGCDISLLPCGTCGFQVDAVVLFESRRERGRLVYVPLFVHPLSAGKQ